MATDGINLYVADTGNYTIRKIVISTGVVTTLAGSAGRFGSADGRGRTARFDWPVGVTTDGTNLYVTDTQNQTIRKIVIATGVVTTLAGTPGVAGCADGKGRAARFCGPVGITNDADNLYVVDTGNCTIRKIVISTGVVTTLAGEPGREGDADGTGIAARFDLPHGIATDGTNLYVTQNPETASPITNGTIRVIRPADSVDQSWADASSRELAALR